MTPYPSSRPASCAAMATLICRHVPALPPPPFDVAVPRRPDPRRLDVWAYCCVLAAHRMDRIRAGRA